MAGEYDYFSGLESLLEDEYSQKTPLGEGDRIRDKVYNGIKNYLVDTTAKVGTYVVPMGLMEYSQGLDFGQIIQSRTSVALIDAVAARIYGKTLNYTRKKFNPESKGSVRGYIVDTTTMLGVYAPIYSGILYSVDAEPDEITSATAILCGILAVTARPFSKYILDPWRKKWNTKQS